MSEEDHSYLTSLVFANALFKSRPDFVGQAEIQAFKCGFNKIPLAPTVQLTDVYFFLSRVYFILTIHSGIDFWFLSKYQGAACQSCRKAGVLTK